MLKSEFCQLASLAVPQLLHALSLSHGADIFWNLINTNFNSKDWKIRFEAGDNIYCVSDICVYFSRWLHKVYNLISRYTHIIKPVMMWLNCPQGEFLFFVLMTCFSSKVVVHEWTFHGRPPICLYNMLLKSLSPTGPTCVVMTTVWLKQAAKRNCGINRGFSRLVIGREELYDLETEAEDRSSDSMYE